MAEKYIIGSENKSGGWRNGGRPKGSPNKKGIAKSKMFSKRVTEAEFDALTEYLNKLRSEN